MICERKINQVRNIVKIAVSFALGNCKTYPSPHFTLYLSVNHSANFLIFYFMTLAKLQKLNCDGHSAHI